MARQTLLDLFEDYSAQDDLFIVHDDGYRVRKTTYRALAAAARTFAERLNRANVRRDDKVIIWSENRSEWIAALWGCLIARAVVVPVDYRASAGFLNKIADVVDARFVLVGNEVPALNIARPIWRLEDEIAIPSNREPGTSEPPPPPRLRRTSRNLGTPASAAASADEPEPWNLAEIIFTSGATADPKGVLITHRNILANLVPIEQEIARYRKLERPFHPIRFLNLLPLSHLFGQTMAAFVPPMIGGTVVFSHGYSPAEILHQIKTRHVSVLVCVPKVLDVLREHLERVSPATAEPDALQARHWLWRWWRYRDVHRLFGWKFWCMVCGAAPLDPDLESFWRKLGFLVVQGYGLTETAPIVTLNHPMQAAHGTVGRPIPGVEVKIAPDGEVLVRGENVTSGYYRSGREGAAGATEDAAAFREEWFHTGDIGEFDTAGQLLIKGRKKEMIVTPQGLNVFPEDVERAILAQPGVKDAAVVGLLAEGEERIHAILVLAPGADPRAIVRHANAALEDHQRVWSISTWPGSALPRTEGTQKLKRRELQRWAAGESGGQPRTTPSATSVSSVVARFAGGREPDPDTTMDELGLSSLDRVELMMALEDAFHVTLDESSVAAARTVGDLERLIGAEPSSAQTPNLEPGTSASAAASADKPGPPPPPRLRRTSRNPFPTWARSRLARVVRRISLPTWILPLARIFMQLRVDGVKHLAAIEGPVIFAANHQSHLDTPAIMIALPKRWRYRLAPAMAREFFAAHFHPEGATRGQRIVIGAAYYLACQFFNAFPLPQSGVGTRDTLRYIGEVLADGDSVLIFPEGKFSETGDIEAFRPGIGMMAARLGVPVVPVRIDGLGKVLHPKMRWPRRGPVRIAFGAPLRLRGDDYAQLARQVEEAVKRL